MTVNVLVRWEALDTDASLFLTSQEISAMKNIHVPSLRRYGVLVIAFAFLLTSCKQGSDAASPASTTTPDDPVTVNPSIPNNPGMIVYPPDNPSTAAKIELGKHLFFDKSLSVDNSTSCASCHTPGDGFADSRGLSTSQGFSRRMGTRNAPALANVAYRSVITWDGKFKTLEEHALAPMFNNIEMGNNFSSTGADPVTSGYYHSDVGQNDTNFLFKRLSGRGKDAVGKTYADLFIAAWGSSAVGPTGVSLDHLAKSIASFERTFISTGSTFDRYNKGDRSAYKFNPKALHGFQLFTDPQKANCIGCHSGYDFTDQQFHNNGIGAGVKDDSGRSDITHNVADAYKFRTPPLRNVALSAPYMHDGRLKTLQDVMAFYNNGGKANVINKDPKIRPLNLSGDDISDIIEFLKTLTDESFTTNSTFNNPWEK